MISDDERARLFTLYRNEEWAKFKSGEEVLERIKLAYRKKELETVAPIDYGRAWATLISSQPAPANSTPVEQVILSPTFNPATMLVSFVGGPNDNSSIVVRWRRRGGSATWQSTSSVVHRYLLPIPPYQSPPLHSALMKGIEQGSIEYDYIVDDGSGVIRSFHSAPAASAPLRFFAFGDVGYTPASKAVIASMIREQHSSSSSSSIDPSFIVLAGDLSYANGRQSVWDEFGQLLSSIASSIPFLAAPGNHELFNLFVPYLERYTFPNASTPAPNLYYSVDIGLVHFIALNGESFDFFHSSRQYKWLEKDLASVDFSKTPWLVYSFHQPFYCSNTVHRDSGWWMRDEFEALMVKYGRGRSLVINGHVHAYERTSPINGIVYTVVGTGGTPEGLYKHWIDPKPSFSQQRFAVNGFATVDVTPTQLHWRFIASNSSVLDDAIIKLNI